MSELSVPQNLDAEMACLGACLCAGADAVEEAAAVIRSPLAFLGPGHATIWTTLTRMAAAGTPIDLFTFRAEIAKRPDVATLERAEAWNEKLLQLADSFADMANVAHYARLVWEAHLRAKLMALGQRMRSQAGNESESVPDLCAVFGSALAEIQEGGTDARSLSAEELVRDAYASLIVPLDVAENPPDRVRVGMFRVDEDGTENMPCVGGLDCGTLTVIGARQSVGKSTLAQQWAIGAARNGYPSLFLSVEMSEKLLRERLASFVAERSWRVIRGQLSPEEQQFQQTRAIDFYRGLGCWFVSARARTPELLAVARQYVRVNKVKLVVVDYIQLCDPGKKAENRNMEISWMSSQWKAFAMQNDVAVILISQLNREGADVEPQMHQLRESGSLEQDADVAFLLWNAEKPDEPGMYSRNPIVRVKVGKHRNGAQFKFDLTFDRQSFKFKDGSEAAGVF